MWWNICLIGKGQRNSLKKGKEVYIKSQKEKAKEQTHPRLTCDEIWITLDRNKTAYLFYFLIFFIFL